jgi:hypothetical protein
MYCKYSVSYDAHKASKKPSKWCTSESFDAPLTIKSQSEKHMWISWCTQLLINKVHHLTCSWLLVGYKVGCTWCTLSESNDALTNIRNYLNGKEAGRENTDINQKNMVANKDNDETYTLNLCISRLLLLLRILRAVHWLTYSSSICTLWLRFSPSSAAVHGTR